MSGRIVFGSKNAAETRTEVFDFISLLAAAETISSASTAATVYSGTDASPSAVISGAAAISGTQVTQKVAGGVVGVVYELTCTAVTSLGQTMTLSGFLAVMPLGL